MHTPGWERIRIQVDSGAIDTVTPKDTAEGVPTRTAEAATSGKGYMAANGSKIANYGEKRVVGYTDDWTGISMTMQCADVRKTLASVHRMNQGGNQVVLDGKDSYIFHKATGKTTPIEYSDGQYIFHMWVKLHAQAAKADATQILGSNRFAALAVDDVVPVGKEGFPRRGPSP